MVQTLRSSLERYEQLKNTEDMLKEDSEENAAKVTSHTHLDRASIGKYLPQLYIIQLYINMQLY